MPILPNEILNNPYFEEEDFENFDCNDNLISDVYIGSKEKCLEYLEMMKKDISKWKGHNYISINDYILRNEIRIFKFNFNSNITKDRILISDFFRS